LSPGPRIFASRQAYKVAILEDIRMTSWLRYCSLGRQTSEPISRRKFRCDGRLDARLEIRQIYPRGVL